MVHSTYMQVCRMAWDVIFVVIVIVEAFSSDEMYEYLIDAMLL